MHAMIVDWESHFHCTIPQLRYKMTTQNKPIVLLIHGAWHIPLHYRYLTDGLRSSGYTVLAPSLVTTGYDDSIDGKTHLDATYQVRAFILPYLDQGHKIVIVSHSYGGIIATQTSVGLTLGERAAQGLKGGIISLVYISALPSTTTIRPRSRESFPFPPGWTDVSILLSFFKNENKFQDYLGV